MWELLPAALADPHCEQWIVYRPLHQPALDRIVTNIRNAPTRHLVPVCVCACVCVASECILYFVSSTVALRSLPLPPTLRADAGQALLRAAPRPTPPLVFPRHLPAHRTRCGPAREPPSRRTTCPSDVSPPAHVVRHRCSPAPRRERRHVVALVRCAGAQHCVLPLAYHVEAVHARAP